MHVPSLLKSCLCIQEKPHMTLLKRTNMLQYLHARLMYNLCNQTGWEGRGRVKACLNEVVSADSHSGCSMPDIKQAVPMSAIISVVS